jgi:hypothetical protein
MFPWNVTWSAVKGLSRVLVKGTVSLVVVVEACPKAGVPEAAKR